MVVILINEPPSLWSWYEAKVKKIYHCKALAAESENLITWLLNKRNKLRETESFKEQVQHPSFQSFDVKGAMQTVICHGF